MMIDIVIFWAATAAAESPVESAGHARAASAPASELRAAVNPAILENAYNAFVAVEESPRLREIVQPAIVTRNGRQRVIVGGRGATPIS